MIHGGRRGTCLDAYPLFRAARYMSVPPWELAEQSAYWRDMALILESAEIAAKNEIDARHAAVNR